MPLEANPNNLIAPSYDQPLGDRQLIFLAGPIQGGPDWQAMAIRALRIFDQEVLIANPRGPEPWHGDYKAQVSWERDHLNHACKHGVVLFWMASEVHHNPRRAYAQTTRVEWGRVFERLLHHEARLVIGMETGFSGRKYIVDMIETETPSIKIHRDLQEACFAALKILGRT
ncbi:MAG: nucleoside 2-deoxyribosyltransferase domain-containing protein [Patescibacteria group bacterium]